MLFLQIGCFALMLTFFSCKEKDTVDNRIENWFFRIKDEIESYAGQKEDSVFYNNDYGSLEVTYYLKGKKLRREHRSADMGTMNFSS